MSRFVSHLTKPSCCSQCGEMLDGAVNVDGTRPGPGDIGICLRCGHVMAYADDLCLRELTDAEMHMIAGEPELLWLQWLRAEYIRKQS